MAKIREPKTFEDAITRIMGILTPEKCGEVIGKSASLVRAASDPDQDKTLNLRDALTLDALYVAEVDSAPPILEAYCAQLQKMSGPKQIGMSFSLKDCALFLHSNVGSFSKCLIEALQESSPGGARLTRTEHRQIFDVLDAIRADLDNASAALESMRPKPREVKAS